MNNATVLKEHFIEILQQLLTRGSNGLGHDVVPSSIAASHLPANTGAKNKSPLTRGLMSLAKGSSASSATGRLRANALDELVSLIFTFEAPREEAGRFEMSKPGRADGGRPRPEAIAPAGRLTASSAQI